MSCSFDDETTDLEVYPDEYPQDYPDAYPAQSKTETPAQSLPRPCQAAENGMNWTAKVHEETVAILAQSDQWTNLGTKLKANGWSVRVFPVDYTSADWDDMGLVSTISWRDPNDRSQVQVRCAFRQIRTIFQLASILGHEWKHAEQMLTLNFARSEAASYTNVVEFCVLGWWEESEAFIFQNSVLEEIVATMSIFGPCAKALWDADNRLRLLHKRNIALQKGDQSEADANLAEFRRVLVNTYSCLRYRDRYKTLKQSASENPAAKDAVLSLLSSDVWVKQMDIWSKFVAPVCQQI